MSDDNLTFERGDKGSKDPTKALKEQLDQKLEKTLEQAAKLELTQTPPGMGNWEVWAWGPWQNLPALSPGRIIKKGEDAYIYVVVWMDPVMCANVTGFSGKIELNFWTSNTQEMRTVSALNHTYCIQTVQGQCWYSYLWKLTPTEAACLYETNICARVCNCDYYQHPEYAGFVRWVYDFDVDLIFPPQHWRFDRPIRYMVYDKDIPCDCPNLPQP